MDEEDSAYQNKSKSKEKEKEKEKEKDTPPTHQFIITPGDESSKGDTKPPSKSRASSSSSSSDFQPVLATPPKATPVGPTTNPAPGAPTSPTTSNTVLNYASTSASAFTAELATETKKWSKLYADGKNDPTNKRGVRYEQGIDLFTSERQKLFHEVYSGNIQDLKGNLSRDALKKRTTSLGTTLAFAYEMVDDKFQWTEEVKAAGMAGGAEYARPSSWSNVCNAIPGIVRSAAMLGLQVAKFTHPEYESSIVSAQGVVNLAYSFVQIGTMGYLPFWNANAQSEAVALQASQGPREMPNVKSDAVVNEDQTEGKLRKKKEIQADIDDVQRKLATAPTDAKLQSDLIKYELEMFIVELYGQLVVTKHSANARAARATTNALTAFFGVFGAAVGFVPKSSDILSGPLGMPQWLFEYCAHEFMPLITNTSALGLLIAQPAVYAWMYRRGSGLDYLAKIATMFEIIAATGKGNFLAGKPAKIDPPRLNKVMKGPFVLRLEYLKSILEYDSRVYLSAMFALRLADKHSGSGGYASIKDEWEKAKDDTERLNLLTSIARDNAPKIKRIHDLYTNNEKTLLELKTISSCKVENLLGKGSHLPTETKTMLQGALEVASGGIYATLAENLEHDRRLSKKKGDTESYCDIGSIHQTAQKLGQAYAWGVAGSSSFNALKAIGSLLQGAMQWEDGEYWADTIRKIALGQNVVQMLGSMLAIALSYSYQKFVSKKTLHRQRDKDKKPMPNAGVMNPPLIRMDRMRQKVSEYRTLAAEQIDPKDVEDVVLDYQSDGSLLKDMLAQMFAVSLKPTKLWKYMHAEGGKIANILNEGTDENDELAAKLLEIAQQQADDDADSNDEELIDLPKGQGKGTYEPLPKLPSPPSEIV